MNSGDIALELVHESPEGWKWHIYKSVSMMPQKRFDLVLQAIDAYEMKVTKEKALEITDKMDETITEMKYLSQKGNIKGAVEKSGLLMSYVDLLRWYLNLNVSEELLLTMMLCYTVVQVGDEWEPADKYSEAWKERKVAYLLDHPAEKKTLAYIAMSLIDEQNSMSFTDFLSYTREVEEAKGQIGRLIRQREETFTQPSKSATSSSAT